MKEQAEQFGFRRKKNIRNMFSVCFCTAKAGEEALNVVEEKENSLFSGKILHIGS